MILKIIAPLEGLILFIQQYIFFIVFNFWGLKFYIFYLLFLNFLFFNFFYYFCLKFKSH